MNQPTAIVSLLLARNQRRTQRQRVYESPGVDPYVDLALAKDNLLKEIKETEMIGASATSSEETVTMPASGDGEGCNLPP